MLAAAYTQPQEKRMGAATARRSAPPRSGSVSLCNLHDNPPDAFGLHNALALLHGRHDLRLRGRGPDWRQINPRIRRDVADGLCVALDHPQKMRIARKDCEVPSSARVQT